MLISIRRASSECKYHTLRREGEGGTGLWFTFRRQLFPVLGFYFRVRIAEELMGREAKGRGGKRERERERGRRPRVVCGETAKRVRCRLIIL